MRKVILAADIAAARSAGQQSISVPEGAIITPQAHDDARDCGISILVGGVPTVAGLPAHPAQASGQSPAQNTVRPAYGSSPANAPAARGASGGTPEKCPATPGLERLFPADAVKKATPAKGGVAMLMADSASGGTTYFAWESASYAWTFDAPATLNILDGAVSVSCGGPGVTAKTGEALRIPSGCLATVTAQGGVRCVLSA